MRITECGHIAFAEDFWDCSCDENYIHRKADNPDCPICGYKHEESPDSRLMEILVYFPELLSSSERIEALQYITGEEEVFYIISPSLFPMDR